MDARLKHEPLSVLIILVEGVRVYYVENYLNE